LVFSKELTALEVLQISKAEKFQKIVNKSAETLTLGEKNMLKAYYIINHSKTYQSSLAELADKRKIQVDSLEQIKEIMVMREMNEPRETFLLKRGQYDQYG
jgi:hypothetical protein